MHLTLRHRLRAAAAGAASVPSPANADRTEKTAPRRSDGDPEPSLPVQPTPRGCAVASVAGRLLERVASGRSRSCLHRSRRPGVAPRPLDREFTRSTRALQQLYRGEALRRPRPLRERLAPLPWPCGAAAHAPPIPAANTAHVLRCLVGVQGRPLPHSFSPARASDACSNPERSEPPGKYGLGSESSPVAMPMEYPGCLPKVGDAGDQRDPHPGVASFTGSSGTQTVAPPSHPDVSITVSDAVGKDNTNRVGGRHQRASSSPAHCATVAGPESIRSPSRPRDTTLACPSPQCARPATWTT